MDKTMLEEIVSNENMTMALKRVVSNKGSAGIDGMTTTDLMANRQEIYLKIQKEILEETYKPKPVKRVEIPKPNGGVRLLGIPTVIDRWIQQAINQKLTEHYEPLFSDSSFGFRPGRSAHQAIEKSKELIKEGYNVVVDIDLAKFFDTVNHDKLMYLISTEIKDKKVLRLIRRYLQAGIMVEGLFTRSEEGTPQGGNLSPLLSNIMLNELDKELKKRGHKFVRYADDCNIYVKTTRAGERVKESVTKYLEKELKLKVNEEKSAVDRPSKRKFLGFSFMRIKDKVKIRVAPKSIQKFKENVREIFRKRWSTSIETRFTRYRKFAVGWCNYFKIAETPSVFEELDEYVRRKARAVFLKHWKKPKTRFRELTKLGVRKMDARKYASSGKGIWRLSRNHTLHKALSVKFLKDKGLIYLKERWDLKMA